MKLVVLSYSHHGRSMARTAHGLGHEIVGVMDAEAGPRQQLSDDFQCPGYETAAACLDASQPDAALVAGKHIEMPDHVQACVDRRIRIFWTNPSRIVRIGCVQPLRHLKSIVSSARLCYRIVRVES